MDLGRFLNRVNELNIFEAFSFNPKERYLTAAKKERSTIGNEKPMIKLPPCSNK
jgi:hypothetical protein